MDLQILDEKKEFFEKNKHWLPDGTIDNYNLEFLLKFNYNSPAIDGNTFSSDEVKMLLQDKVSVGNKNLKELYEIINHKNTFEYIKKSINDGKDLNEEIIKEIHRRLNENICDGGKYRIKDTYISGSRHIVPSHSEISLKMKNFYNNLENKKSLSALKLAAWTHCEFLKIFPFACSNGKVARLLINYQLMSKGFLPISIDIIEKDKYFEATEKYSCESDFTDLVEIMSELENIELDKYNKLIQKSLDNN